MREYLAIMGRSRVRHLMAYGDCAAELVRFAREKRIPVRPLDSLMACAGRVTPDSQLESLGGRLERDLAAVFGQARSVRVRRVDVIPESSSGKFLYVASQVRG